MGEGCMGKKAALITSTFGKERDNVRSGVSSLFTIRNA